LKTNLLAYCAGVIDSDGSIGISYRNDRKGIVGSCREIIIVKQVEPQAVELLHHLFGGSKWRGKSPSPTSQRQWAWGIYSLKAVFALKLLIPYLRIKQRQAKNLVELRRQKEKARRGLAPNRSARMTPALRRCIVRAYQLNSIGRSGRTYGHKPNPFREEK
jgi:hypothetical protein